MINQYQQPYQQQQQQYGGQQYGGQQYGGQQDPLIGYHNALRQTGPAGYPNMSLQSPNPYQMSYQATQRPANQFTFQYNKGRSMRTQIRGPLRSPQPYRGRMGIDMLNQGPSELDRGRSRQRIPYRPGMGLALQPQGNPMSTGGLLTY